MSEFDITVVGYPRSGNTWVARLLGDALDSKVTGFEAAVPLATEGRGRRGKYTIRQLHLSPDYSSSDDRGFFLSGWKCAVNNWNGERIVHVIRDPRDVVVSAYYYWERPSIQETIYAMAEGREPFFSIGSYHDYVRRWLSVKDFPVHMLNFEILHANPAIVLLSLLSRMNIPNDDRGNLIKVVERQEINAKRKQITGENSNDEPRPYGKTIQLKHLRKGVPGEWKKEFSLEDGELMDNLFNDIMVELGYLFEGDHGWYNKLKARNER